MVKAKNPLEVFPWSKQFCAHQDIFGGNKLKSIIPGNEHH